jgi:hypothetical protein
MDAFSFPGRHNERLPDTASGAESLAGHFTHLEFGRPRHGKASQRAGQHRTCEQGLLSRRPQSDIRQEGTGESFDSPASTITWPTLWKQHHNAHRELGYQARRTSPWRSPHGYPSCGESVGPIPRWTASANQLLGDADGPRASRLGHLYLCPIGNPMGIGIRGCLTLAVVVRQMPGARVEPCLARPVGQRVLPDLGHASWKPGTPERGFIEAMIGPAFTGDAGPTR